MTRGQSPCHNFGSLFGSFLSIGSLGGSGLSLSPLDALRQAGSAIYRTDQCGDITCNICANKLTVTTQS